MYMSMKNKNRLYKNNKMIKRKKKRKEGEYKPFGI